MSAASRAGTPLDPSALARWRARLPFVGFLALATTLFFPALTGKAVFFRRDIHGLFYPRIETFVRSVAEGAWPLWDPLSGFGLPLLADPTTQTAYPFTWLNLILPPTAYYAFFAFFHDVVAGVGLYLLCRRWGLAPAPSFLAGALWSSSGPFLSLIEMAPLVAAAWIPWVLWALDMALETPTAGPCLRVGVLAALQCLAGGVEMSIATGILGVVFAGLRLGRPLRPSIARCLRVGGIALAWALALAAIQILPTLALLRSSSRLALDPAINMYWSLHPLSLPDLVVPGLSMALPLAPAARGALFEGRGPLLSSVYLGAGAAVLVALVPLTGRRRLLLLASVGFGFFLLAALGRHTPVFTFVLLPLLRLFRYPVKYLVPAALLWSVLAALGAEALLREWSKSERRHGYLLAVGAGLVAIAAFLTGTESPATPLAAKLWPFAGIMAAMALLIGLRARRSQGAPWILVGLVGILAIDNVSAARKADLLSPPELATHRPPVLQELGPNAADHRIYVASRPTPDLVAHGPAGWRREWAWELGLREMLYPPTAACWRLAGSFDDDIPGLGPPELSLLNRTLARVWGTPLALRLLQMGNVGYVITLDDAGPDGFAEVASLPSVFRTPIRLLRVPDPLPRAYVVGRARTTPDPIAGIVDPAFDAHREVILPEGAPVFQEAPGFRGGARVVESRADRLKIEVEASAPAVLVVPQTHHPGWRATVDGLPAVIWRANVIFRAVTFPQGRHVVEMRYRPAAVQWGAILSLGAWVTAALWAAHRARARREGSCGA